MICFPNAKINIGLHITGKRPDGFHNIETVFYPVYFYDIVEVISSASQDKNDCNLFVSGLAVSGADANNLCIKAYGLLKKDFPQLPAVDIYLHKNIPIGAGLGGGSADGAFMLSVINEKFQLNINENTLYQYALQLGSDCPFFIKNKPCFATGRGEQLETIDINLKGYYLFIANPGIHVNTATAFSKIKPLVPEKSIKEIIKTPVEEWKNFLMNDFEKTVFAAYPVLNNIKQKMYDAGAVYTSMTGTGSTVYGLFKNKTACPQNIFSEEYFVKEILL